MPLHLDDFHCLTLKAVDSIDIFFTSVITTLLASSSPRRPLATRHGPRCRRKARTSFASSGKTRGRLTQTITTLRLRERIPLPPPSCSHPCPPCRSCDCSFLLSSTAALLFCSLTTNHLSSAQYPPPPPLPPGS